MERLNSFCRKYPLLFTAVPILTFLLGAVLARLSFPHAMDPTSLRVNAKNIREGGAYAFINPLLACDTLEGSGLAENKVLEKKINDFISQETAERHITTASVYFHDFENINWVGVNEYETFYPASLGKVPLLIAYLKKAERDPNVLSQTIDYNDGYNANTQQEITSSHWIAPGHSYTIEELLKAMILYSDNNATEFLYNNIDEESLREVYSDIGVPFLRKNEAPQDFVNTKAFGLFFRILYNATYLSKAYSEKALQLLSQTEFKDGIIAGIPANTPAPHKFGLVSIAPDGVHTTSRELHDCGIIYSPKSNYALCIMTKGVGSVAQMEKVVAGISSLVYEEAQKSPY